MKINIDKMRPLELYSKLLLMREESGVSFYLNNCDKFVEITCPACGIIEEKVCFFKYGYSHKKCKKCNTLYVSPRPTENMLFDFYETYDAPKAWNDILIETNTDRKYLQHIPRVEKLKEIVCKSQNKQTYFVDLGAGNGNFAKAVQEGNIFKTVIATDISDNCVASCKSQGLDSRKCTVTDFDDDSIDCITFNDLIEHVFNPYEFLSNCYKKLSNNGLLMLSTPNGEGFDFKILNSETENIVPPEHIQFFNPRSIKIILENVGFEILDISTPGFLDIDIIKRQVTDKNYNLKQNNAFLDFIYSLNSEDVENSFQEFLQKNNLSSHMLVFAIKNR